MYIPATAYPPNNKPLLALDDSTLSTFADAKSPHRSTSPCFPVPIQLTSTDPWKIAVYSRVYMRI